MNLMIEVSVWFIVVIVRGWNETLRIKDECNPQISESHKVIIMDKKGFPVCKKCGIDFWSMV